MGFIQPKERILVTGANGFIGAHCVAHLLSHGFQVIATTRTRSKSEQVSFQHSSNPLLSVKVVPDLTDLHAFDEAIQGCSGVLHLASPFGYAYKDFEKELLIPSINGTRSICLAATRTPSVKRVVLTSSFAAVFDASAGPSPGRVYTEKDWSPLTYEDGKNATVTPVAYRASKVLAEKAAWDFVAEEKPRWDLVTLCPGMVFGPLVPGTIKSLQQVNASNAIIWSLFDAEKVPETKAPLWTSVKTLAQAHTLALTTPDAGNERFLLINGDFDNQELADIIRASELIPASAKARVPVGKPGDRLKGNVFTADSSKVANILGLDLAASGDDLGSTVVGFVKQALKLEEEGEKS